MKYLYKFNWTGKYGNLDGLFVANDEVLGKYSEIYGKIEDSKIKKIDIDNETLEKITAILGETWCGYNPLNYIEGEE